MQPKTFQILTDFDWSSLSPTHRLVSHVLDHALHHRRLPLNESEVAARRGVVEAGLPQRPHHLPVANEPQVVVPDAFSALGPRSRMPPAPRCNGKFGEYEYKLLDTSREARR